MMRVWALVNEESSSHCGLLCPPTQLDLDGSHPKENMWQKFCLLMIAKFIKNLSVQYG